VNKFKDPVYRREYMRKWRLKKGIPVRKSAVPPICGHEGKPRKGNQLCRACYVRKNRFPFLLKHRYGITEQTYLEKWSSQGGGCAICGDVPARRLAVDHDHKTGQIRGLLCVRCNAGIGNFNENPDLMIKAISYIRGWSNSECVQHIRK